MSLLETSKLIKTYGLVKETRVEALKSTNLNIEQGEFVSIIGSSGSGKSTLLHLMAGLDTPSSGKVYIAGNDIYAMNEKELAKFRRQNIGFIFQFFNLIPILTVEENIKLPLIMDKQKIDEAYFEEIIQVLGLEDRKKHLPNEISGGQQQRVAIARALMSKPKIIFADEPTGNLDSKNTQEVLELLAKSIKKYNQTLVMITHDPEIAKTADRIIVLKDGVAYEGEEAVSSLTMVEK
ncbi:putative ABC transport system ATP-binding protein [Clostridium collagenovorans DSM 3089]|uniref:Putative ABC transport system ATP-binding protein n=1 Tax=Clostridium collagenovorans DSM 3089 TaxID=1121306 RepID=A0A1M5Y2Q3_9CLOT|nr:ABC transporter ATP-binding protein [Clostridium collagenovorans]SHI06078.1 putative ABC transport system ATP-binding protein [Clostridium collagenovorans DSM 3089]